MVVAVVAGAELSALELSKVTEKENRNTNKCGTEGGIEGSSEEGEGEREGGKVEREGEKRLLSELSMHRYHTIFFL